MSDYHAFVQCIVIFVHCATCSLQVSVSLMDIALECLATLQGETQQTYQLTPSEIKATARLVPRGTLRVK